MGSTADGMENKFQPRYQFPRSFLVVVAHLSMEPDDMVAADGLATQQVTPRLVKESQMLYRFNMRLVI